MCVSFFVFKYKFGAGEASHCFSGAMLAFVLTFRFCSFYFFLLFILILPTS